MSKLYTLAPLAAVRAVVEEKRPIKVLALGPSAATYPARLEEELEKVLSGIDVDMEQRSLPGDILADAFDRFTALLTEIEPDLLVWQVGINDALAKAEIEAFTNALNEMLEWLKQTDTDVVLVEPSYHAALASDEHYNALITAIRNSARKNHVPLVLRFEAMRFLSHQKAKAAQNQFQLNELGYQCLAEYVARTNNSISPQLSSTKHRSAEVSGSHSIDYRVGFLTNQAVHLEAYTCLRRRSIKLHRSRTT